MTRAGTMRAGRAPWGRGWRQPIARLATGLLAALALVSAAPARGAAQDSARAGRTTRLIGRVLDSARVPVSGAHVTILPARVLEAVTTDSGTFAFDSVPVGTVELSVRRLGYAPATFTARVHAGRIERVTLQLSPVAFELPPVAVADTVAHPWLRIFDRRRSHGGGTYFTRQDIVRSQVRNVSDLLRRVPGVMVEPTRFGTHVVFNTGLERTRPCRPQVFVHTMSYSGEVDDISPDDIEAMEVYTSIATVPAELQSARAQSCGAIVIWTREPPPKR
ncbi:MAG: carboxypeptidase regulatory-like domain-containing protein [Gemmatimonadota bacterium]|nr:carboxypeptidase regulatory-like domain-containing protein [Gemmatimonadota bacterium]